MAQTKVANGFLALAGSLLVIEGLISTLAEDNPSGVNQAFKAVRVGIGSVLLTTAANN